MAYNGNLDFIVFPQQVRTAPDSPVIKNNEVGRGLELMINVITPGTGSVTFKIWAVDQFGNLYLLLASAALTTAGQTLLTVYPAAPTTANVSANAPLPKRYAITAVHADGSNWLYTASASIIM